MLTKKWNEEMHFGKITSWMRCGINVQAWSRESSFATLEIIWVTDDWNLNWEVVERMGKETDSKDVMEREIIKLGLWTEQFDE